MDKSNAQIKPNTLKIILRWFAVLPAAIGGLFIGSIFINLLNLINSWYFGVDEKSGWMIITHYIVGPAVGSLLAVYWGTEVAPNNNKIVAMVLATLIIILATLSGVGLIVYNESDMLWSLASCAATIIAAVYVAYNYLTKGDEFKLFE